MINFSDYREKWREGGPHAFLMTFVEPALCTLVTIEKIGATTALFATGLFDVIRHQWTNEEIRQGDPVSCILTTSLLPHAIHGFNPQYNAERLLSSLLQHFITVINPFAEGLKEPIDSSEKLFHWSQPLTEKIIGFAMVCSPQGYPLNIQGQIGSRVSFLIISGLISITTIVEVAVGILLGIGAICTLGTEKEINQLAIFHLSALGGIDEALTALRAVANPQQDRGAFTSYWNKLGLEWRKNYEKGKESKLNAKK